MARTWPNLTSCMWGWACFSCDFPAKVIGFCQGVGAVGGTSNPQQLPHGLVVALTCVPPSDDAEQVWVWEYETEEGAHDLYMDTGEEIRFRVVDESFVDTSPSGPSSAEAASSSEEQPKKEAPYTLVVRRPDVLPTPWGLDGRTQRQGGRAPPCVLTWVPLLEPRPSSGYRSLLCGLRQSLLPGEPPCREVIKLPRLLWRVGSHSPTQKRGTESTLGDQAAASGPQQKKPSGLGSQSEPQGGVIVRAAPTPGPAWA